MDWKTPTLDYYNQNSDAFVSSTLSADMTDTQSRFLSCLPANGTILDFGCGSGRDTKAFGEAGYQVDAIDGSEELCVRASEYTGIPVKKMLFSELDAKDRYDGIWACASILHLPKAELLDALCKIAAALKAGGVLYASFKYGEFEGIRNGRHFTDFTEESLKAFLTKVNGLQIKEMWTTQDVRAERHDLKWINVLAEKV